METHWLLFACALLAGAVLPLQAGINSQLTGYLGHALQASLVSFVVGSLGLFAYCLSLGLPWPRWGAVPAGAPWLWIGGLLGAFYVASTIFLAPKLGAATMIGLIVAGQLTASLLLDHWGLVGFPVHPAGPVRLLGVLLIFTGVLLVARF